MNKIFQNKYPFLFLITVFSSGNIYSQCMNPVTHESGTTEINGIEVTVTGAGDSDTTTFCADAQPYYIGADVIGSYTFQFSPPVDSVTFNVSSIHKSATYEEVVKIRVNGIHYSIPAIGTPNSCSENLPILTSEGTLGAESNGLRHGCNDISIVGPISEITVIDSIVTGTPGGVLFSMFICSESVVSSTSTLQPSDIKIYPIPSSERIIIEGIPNDVSDINLFDQFGRQLNPSVSKVEAKVSMDVSTIPFGVYYVVIQTNKGAITRKVIIGE